jgi:hypothetical protein
MSLPENQFCLEFMQTADQGQMVEEAVKLKFTLSLTECLSAGYYLAHGQKGWKLSNKNPESRERQQRDMATMVNTLFEKQ